LLNASGFTSDTATSETCLDPSIFASPWVLCLNRLMNACFAA
jgi:hypothetical protein